MLADLHTHTNTSHGHHSAAEMYEGAAAAGLDLFGLSEHSPLPEEYACKLYVAAFPGNFRQFVQDVQALRQRELEREDRPLPLLGVELDWLPDYPRHMCRFLSCWPFSYVIGSLHYVGLFPVARPNTWTDGREAAYARYREYYEEMARMAASGLVNVASHPDFIKRASYDLFHAWLREEGSLDVVAGAVQAMADNGVILRLPFRHLAPAAGRHRHPARRAGAGPGLSGRPAAAPAFFAVVFRERHPLSGPRRYAGEDTRRHHGSGSSRSFFYGIR